MGAVAEAVDQGVAQGRLARHGEVAVQVGHVALEGVVAAEVVVLGVDARVQHRPGDAAAGGVEGAAGRVRLDGGAGGVDQGVDGEVGPDPVDGPPGGVRLPLVGLDQAQDVGLGELAAEVGVGHPLGLGGVLQGGPVVGPELLGRPLQPVAVAQVELDHHRDGGGRAGVEADPLPLLGVHEGVGDDRPLDQGAVPAAGPLLSGRLGFGGVGGHGSSAAATASGWRRAGAFWHRRRGPR